MIPVSKIVEAYERVQKVAQKTPFNYAPHLSGLVGAEVFLKKENLQHTGAYKLRGAFNRIASLVDEGKVNQEVGVIAASAGNHAQGVAYSASYFGIPGVIVMPDATPLTKVTGVRNYGGEVILKGSNYDEAYAYALEYAKEKGFVFVHPFADEEVIAGQGTVALEMIQERPEVQTVLVPIGGGGLISGLAGYYKQLKPSVRVIGVTAKGAPAMYDSYQQKKAIDSTSVRTIADGIAVRDANPENLERILESVDEMVQVDDEEIANAVLFLLERQKIVVEGAGSVGVAALLHGKVKLQPDEKVGVVLSGGNIDVTMLSVIIEKGLLKSARKMRLVVTLIDKPGSLMLLTEILQQVNANIVQIGYDRVSTALDYGDANVTIALETKGVEHQEEIRAHLQQAGFKFREAE